MAGNEARGFYAELREDLRNPEIKEALDSRELVSFPMAFLALFQERKMRPHRAHDSTQLVMIILG